MLPLIVSDFSFPLSRDMELSASTDWLLWLNEELLSD